MNKAELAAVIVDTERDIRQLLAKQAAALAEIDARGVLAETGYSDLSTLLVDLIHIDGRAATKRVNRATALFARPGISGGEIPAVAPQAADALAVGAIGVEHVDPIQHALSDLPADVSDARRGNVEAELVKLATSTTPQHVAKAGRRARDVLDPDGPAPDEREHAHPARALRAGWLRDGRYGINGELDAETGKLFERLMSPFTKPNPPKTASAMPAPPMSAGRTGSRICLSGCSVPWRCRPRPVNDPPSSLLWTSTISPPSWTATRSPPAKPAASPATQT